MQHWMTIFSSYAIGLSGTLAGIMAHISSIAASAAIAHPAPAAGSPPASHAPPPALQGGQVLTLAGVAGMVLAGFLITGLPLQVLPLFVHRELGFGSVVVGLTVGLQALAALASRAPAGALVDRRGGRAAIMLGMAVAGAGALSYALAGWAASPAGAASAGTSDGSNAGWALAAILLGRVLVGTAESLLVGGALSWGITALGVQHSGRVMVWVGIALFAALGLGAPLGLVLYQQWGIAALAGGTLGAALIALLVAAMLKAPAVLGGVRTPFYRVLGQVMMPGLGLACGGAGFAVLCTFGALHFVAQGWPYAIWLIPAFTVCYILPRLIWSGLPDRLGGARVALVCLIVQTLGLVLFALADGPLTALAGAALTGAGFSLVFPSFGREAVLRVAPASRGSALSAYVAFFDLALAVTGPLTGLLVAHAGYPAVFVCGAVAALAGLGCAVALATKRPQ